MNKFLPKIFSISSILALMISLFSVVSPALADNTTQMLPFSQDWSNNSLITVNDDWSGTAGVVGFLGQDITTATGTDPQTLLTVSSAASDVDVIANQTNTGISNGGVAEFHITDPVVAFQGSGTADAPHIILYLNTTGQTNITISYNLRDIDASADNAVQPVALQYRVGASGDFTNIPAGFVADATTGPSLATLITPVIVQLPAAAENQSEVQIRIMTTNAVGNDEWVGIDDINVSASLIDLAPTVTVTSPANGAADVAIDANIDVAFSETVNASSASFTVSCMTSGVHTVTVSGGPETFTLDPDTNFDNGEMCTVTVPAAQVTDQDSNDPPDNMEADYAFSFDTVSAATADMLVINEIDYDQPSTDTAEFVEIRNNDSVSVDLSSYSLQMINGNGGAQYQLFALPAVNLAPGDYFVLCGNAGNTPNCDLDVTPNTDLVQNGAPDAVALLFGASIVDTVSYEGDTVAPYTEGSGIGLEDPGTTGNINLGISRLPDGVDTNQNNADFSLRCITPGEANSSSTSSCTLDVPPAVASTSPTNGATGISVSNNIGINFSEAVSVSGNWFSISCANSGVHAATVSGGPQNYALDPDVNFAFSESCSVTIVAASVADQDGTPNNMAADYNFSFITGAEPFVCGGPAAFIHDIQGSGPASPLDGNVVTVEGVVVGSFQGTNQLGGFYIQEEDAEADADLTTSEGIFIFNSANAPAIGDTVRIQGTVDEFYGLTELNNVANFLNCGTGGIATAAALSLPVTSVDDFEAFEGMAVTFPQALYISEYFNFDRYGEIVLTSERHLTPTAEFEPGAPSIQAAQEFLLDKITLDDGRSNQNPDPAIHPNGGVFDLTNLFRGGDTLQNVTGVLDYSFGLYRIQPTQGADYVSQNPRMAEPDDVDGNIKVASFNVLNYFTTIDTGAFICGPAADQECRGADDADELARQRAKIIAALTAIDADIVGLIEIENHPADVPTADLVSGLNDMVGAGTYDYIPTGPIGTDAIRLAIIYKPASVMPLGSYAVLDSSVDSRFIDTKNRPALAQSFFDYSTGGIFTVAVNHFKSKGSDCNDVGDPDLGDGAGNCNLTRKAAAEALVDWLATDPTASGDGDFLIIGDLNSYDKEDPIDAIKAGPDDAPGTSDDYLDMVYQFMGEDAYSYVFDGQLGYLDHALANTSLANQVTGVTDWHINSDEPDLIDYDTSFKLPAQDAIYALDAYRASDHDPVIIGLNLEISPRPAKQHVLDSLTALRATVTNRKDARKLDEAIWHLTRSLRPILWVDNNHVSSKYGWWVFEEEKNTVNKLNDILRDRRSTLPKETIQEYIDFLVGADRGLAQVAIDDAIAQSGNARDIARAKAALAVGDKFLSAGKIEPAIEMYRMSWNHAMHAVR